MKKLNLLPLLLAGVLFCVKSIHGQVVLNHNNVAANVMSHGMFFNNFSNEVLGYEVPKGSGFTSIFGAQCVFGAKDLNDSIYIVHGGNYINQKDIFSGPISGAYSDSAYINRWKNRVWKICKGDIDQFRLWWLCNNGQLTSGCDTVTVPNLEVLNVIYDWPAHGDVIVGESYWLAPYYDFNSDGNYNPDDGDYPLIKGCCATYMIQNDAAGSHTYSNTKDSMGIEVHTMIYQYSTADEINDATFVDVSVYNRSANNYPEFKMGLLVDADLGYYGDDYYGCDSVKNTMYFYNADNNDDFRYGLNPPSLGVISLNQPMAAFHNPGFVNGVGLTREQKYWNIYNGLNQDGASYLHPNGYPTNYVFSGDPTVPTDWTAFETGNPIGDCRGLMMSPSLSLAPGQSVSNTYAIVYERSGGNHIENASALLSRVPFYLNAIQTNLEDQCQDAFLEISEKPAIQTTFNIYPNPTTDNLTISEISLSLIGQKGIIIDLNGKQILDFEITQQEQQIDCSTLKKGVYFLRIREVFQKIMVE